MRIRHIIFSLFIFVCIKSEATSICSRDTVSICIMGDMMMHQRQIDLARRTDGSFDFSSYFACIEDRIKSSDIAIANMLPKIQTSMHCPERNRENAELERRIIRNVLSAIFSGRNAYKSRRPWRAKSSF